VFPGGSFINGQTIVVDGGWSSTKVPIRLRPYLALDASMSLGTATPSAEGAIDLSSYVTLRLERQGRLLRASFNRPEALNAIDKQAHDELARFFSEIATDVLADVVILSGIGRAFSAGGDLGHIQDMIDTPELFLEDLAAAKRIVFGLLDCPKIVIAKLNGHAIGIGCTIALPLRRDLRRTERQDRRSPREIRLHRRRRRFLNLAAFDWSRASQGVPHDGPIAHSGRGRTDRLINHVVPASDLDRVVDEFAHELLRGAMRAIQWTKLSVNIGLKRHADAVLDASLKYEALSNVTNDHQEAVQAFREKAPSAVHRQLGRNEKNAADICSGWTFSRPTRR